jgi:hypothetical protein
LAITLSGCATEWTVADDTADLVTVMSHEERAKTAIRAIDERGEAVWFRGDTLDLTSEPPSAGRRRIYQRLNATLVFFGGFFMVSGVALSAGGGVVWQYEADSAQRCRENNGFFCIGPIVGPILVSFGVISLVGGLIMTITSWSPPVQVKPVGNLR